MLHISHIQNKPRASTAETGRNQHFHWSHQQVSVQINRQISLNTAWNLSLTHIIITTKIFLSKQQQHWKRWQSLGRHHHGPALPKNNEDSLQMAERLLRAQPDSVANHVTDHLISDRRALTWLAIQTGWTQNVLLFVVVRLSVATWFDTTWIGGTVSRI